jgi:hypothetical protein
MRFSIFFWHILCANIAWGLASGLSMWYIFSKDGRIDDNLFRPFIVFYLLLGWFTGIVSGLTWRKSDGEGQATFGGKSE